MQNIPNYFERAVALLASQFQIRNSDGSLTNLQKVVQALTMQAQVLNTQEQLLITMRYLNTAQGVQLDGLGQILGLARISGQSDYSYREDLQFQIFINQSTGTPEDVIGILRYLTDASIVWYNEQYPAAYQLATNGLLFPQNPSDLASVMQKVSPAGVSMTSIVATYNTVPFVFSGDPFEEQFYVNPNIADPSEYNPFQVDPGSGLVDLYINRGNTHNPDFGGGFAEAIGQYPIFSIDSTNAGRMVEAIQINGNLPPGP